VHLLELKNESMQEMVTDILWALVNLLSVKSGEFAQHFLRSGAIRALTGLIDVKLSSFYSKQHTLLALTIMTNLAADQYHARKEIISDLSKHITLKNVPEKDSEDTSLGTTLTTLIQHIGK
jgi:hypothetical protein